MHLRLAFEKHCGKEMAPIIGAIAVDEMLFLLFVVTESLVDCGVATFVREQLTINRDVIGIEIRCDESHGLRTASIESDFNLC